jgi:hypothetical protein
MGYNHGNNGYWAVPPSPNRYQDTFMPDNQYFSEGNGGEYRKSYHGYPAGFAQLVYSPQFFQMMPMQIDTHNRDYNGPGFKAGILPKESQAPPNASYSGLLECPCTTRIEKKWGITYTTQFNNTCQTPAQNASECFMAITSLGMNIIEKRTVSDSNLAPGCHVIYSETGNVTALFNTLNNTRKCSVGKVLSGFTTALITVSLELDTTVKDGEATITMTGPDGVWFGVGWNADAMGERPYVIIVDGQGAVTERKLGDHDPGIQLSPTQVQVKSNNVINGNRTVILTRVFKGATPMHYTFNPATSNIPFINAIGSTPYFDIHKIKGTGSLYLSIVGEPTCVCNDGLHGWINGISFHKSCAAEPTADLVQQKNPTCWIQTYVGGQLCCHHQNILLDADQPVDNRIDVTFLKFRFYYQDYVPAQPPSKPKPSHLNLHRFYFQTEAYSSEYDIIQCPAGTPPSECVSEITARWQVKDMLDCNPKDHPDTCQVGKNGINLIYAGGHCHAPSCISIELYNADTGELICRQTPIWGTGNDIFNEIGYLSIPPCLWGNEKGLVPPMLLQLDTNLLSVKKNNNTYGHYGEMASWQMRGIFL